MRALRAFAAIGLAVALSGCLEGKKISDIDDPTAIVATPGLDGTLWRVPVGVAIGSTKRGALLIDGLYPSIVASESCCWLAPTARVLLDAPLGARHANLALLVEQYSFFERHPPTVTLRIEGRVTHVADLVPGLHHVTIDLPQGSDLAARTLAIHTEPTFIPAHEGINTDTRGLGIILTSIAYF
jgi:hypothetical protein